MTSAETTHDPYAGIAAYYDLEHDPFDDDLECLLNFVISTGDPVLELGAGSGRVMEAIAGAGFRITGIDTSAEMLAAAERRLRAPKLKRFSTLVQLDMLQASHAPGGPFGVVIASLNSLQHLTTQTEQRTALRQAQEALDPRGQLLIDLMNPTPSALAALDHQLVLEGTYQREDGSTVQKFSSRRIAPSEQLIHTDLWYDVVSPDGSVRRTATSFDMRYITRAELELMLEFAGFSSWETYGSYDLDPYDDHSDRLFVAAEKS
jgi:cyclopropane fatty-acyl-phospholipid synthase-like methyltransferase